MIDSELFHLLALLKTEGIGDITAKKLLTHVGSATAIFEASSSQLQQIENIGPQLVKRIKEKQSFNQAEAEIKFIENQKIQVLYYQDANYPNRLKHCIDAPVLLFASGNLPNYNRNLSVVGTRNITNYGTTNLKNIISQLQPFTPNIISGFAYGVDITAHLEAIAQKLPTIAVLAHGLNQIYPKVHKKYVHLLEQNGGFITEFWSTSQPEKENFVKRNRIVAGMAEATLVVESAAKGGSLITALLANDYNREVFAIPGRTTDKYSEGCNNLIKTQQAQLVHTGTDIAQFLNWELKPEKNVQKQLFITLDPQEELIYNYLQANGKTLLDTLAKQCQIPVYRLSSILLNMELKGAINPLPGKLYEAI